MLRGDGWKGVLSDVEGGWHVDGRASVVLCYICSLTALLRLIVYDFKAERVLERSCGPSLDYSEIAMIYVAL